MRKKGHIQPNITFQNCWNDFENIVITIVDKLAPMKEFSNISVKYNPPPRYIQRKIKLSQESIETIQNQTIGDPKNKNKRTKY